MDAGHDFESKANEMSLVRSGICGLETHVCREYFGLYKSMLMSLASWECRTVMNRM